MARGNPVIGIEISHAAHLTEAAVLSAVLRCTTHVPGWLLRSVRIQIIQDSRKIEPRFLPVKRSGFGSTCAYQ
jgi:hypothetical protein